MKFKCLMQSNFGDNGSIVEYPECERTRQLVARKIITPYQEKKPKESPKVESKGGQKAKSATKTKVETKE